MSDPWSSYRSGTRNTRPRLIWSSYGEEGTRKTTFGLEGPAPVFVQSLDYGLEGVVDRFPGKEIIEVNYEWNPTEDTTQEAAIELRDRFVQDYRYALKHARTILWDKETQVYPMFTAAEWPEGYKPEPREWAPLQQRYRAIINEAKSTDVNFGLIQGMKSPWEMKQVGGRERLTKTKDRIRRGFAEIGELVHVNIEHFVELLPGQEPSYRFMIRTDKMRGPGAQSMQYQTMPAVSFSDFGQLLFPDSKEEDWA